MSEKPQSPLEAWSDALALIVAAIAPSIVTVESAQARSSGFAWRPNLIVTADEALPEDGEVTVVTAGGDRRVAAIVGRDPSTDVALLRIEGAALPAVDLTAPVARTGAFALVVGGGPHALSGIVAVAGPSWHSVRGGEIDARIELDLRLRRHTEGGLALDAGGKGIGMAVFGPRRRTLVIPAATVERAAARLERDGRVRRGYLGVALHPVRADGDGAAGALIVNLDRDGPGAAAGLHQGDIVISWDGQTLADFAASLRALGPDSIGRSLTLGLRRSGASLSLSVTVGERPQA
jgi:S1-C subfamily serine protease